MEEQKMHTIILQEGLKLTQKIKKLGIILFSITQTNKVQIFTKRKCLVNKKPHLVSQGQFNWLIKACSEETQSEYEQIERIVRLSQTTICIDLPNSIESSIQKTFWNTKNQSNAYISNNKLVFIKEIYNNRQNISEIRYFHNVSQALAILQQKNMFDTVPTTISDLIQLFDCQKSQNISKVKAIHRNYEQIRKNQQKMDNIHKIIFSYDRSKAQILKEIQKLNLSKFQQNKLIWKMTQMHRYKDWLEQEKQSQEINYSKLTFQQLNDRISFTSIFRFRKHWSYNSFLKLKHIFNKINGLEDLNNIKEFHKQYNIMRSNLQKIVKNFEKLPQGILFSEMLNQMESFFKYHQSALKNDNFSSFVFAKGQAKYIWKYKNNFYKKIGAFALFGGLAYFQQDFVKTATFLILAVLILTLRC